MVIDPVCSMAVQEETAAGSRVYGEKIYYFCSQGCMDAFAADPEKFLRDTDLLGRKMKPK